MKNSRCVVCAGIAFWVLVLTIETAVARIVYAIEYADQSSVEPSGGNRAIREPNLKASPRHRDLSNWQLLRQAKGEIARQVLEAIRLPSSSAMGVNDARLPN